MRQEKKSKSRFLTFIIFSLAAMVVFMAAPDANAKQNRGGGGGAPGPNVGQGKGCTLAGAKFKHDLPGLTADKRVTLIMRWQDTQCGDPSFDLLHTETGIPNDTLDVLRITPRFTITLNAPLTLPVGTYTISTFNFGPVQMSGPPKETSLTHVLSDDLLPGFVLPGDFIALPNMDAVVPLPGIEMSGQLFYYNGDGDLTDAPLNLIPNNAISWGVRYTMEILETVPGLPATTRTEMTFPAGAFIQGDTQLNIYGSRRLAVTGECALDWSETGESSAPLVRPPFFVPALAGTNSAVSLLDVVLPIPNQPNLPDTIIPTTCP